MDFSIFFFLPGLSSFGLLVHGSLLTPLAPKTGFESINSKITAVK
jgi:hypothetical protein